MTQNDFLSIEFNLARISKLTQSARGVWITYLVSLVFIGVTLIDVKDSDFFSVERSTELPLIGVSVPVVLFFYFSAPLITIIYVYQQVTTEKLWRLLGNAPARIGQDPLESHIEPWLVSTMALTVRSWLRAESAPCVEPSPLGIIGVWTAGFLFFAVGPLLQGMLWFWSMPAHIFPMSALIGAMLGVTLWAASASILAMLAGLRELPFGPMQLGSRLPWAQFGTLAAIVVMLIGVSACRTEFDPLGYSDRATVGSPPAQRLLDWFRPVRAKLNEVQIVPFDPEWQIYRDAKTDFFFEWCKRPDTGSCDNADLEDRNFHFEWKRRRQTYLLAMVKPNLSGRDLSFARLRFAHLPGVDFRGSNLSRADLSAAELEGSDLAGANLTGSILIGSRLKGVRLYGSNLSEATLVLNVTEGLDLRWARLDEAEITGTFRGVRLTYARLRNVEISGDFSNSDLSYAYISYREIPEKFDLPAVTNLNLKNAGLNRTALRNIDLTLSQVTSDQISSAYGDASVKLPLAIQPPCHWGDKALSDQEFMAQWRGWVEGSMRPMSVTTGEFDPEWKDLVPDNFATIEPTDPKLGCG